MTLTPDALFIVCRFTHFTALMLLTGSSLFSALLSGGETALLLQTRLRTTVRGAALLTVLTTVLWLLLQAALMGDGWADMQDPDIILAVLSTAFGDIWRWQLLLAALLAAGLFIRSGRRQNQWFLLCVVPMLILHAFTGHGMVFDGGKGVLHQVVQAVHLLSAAYWFGGLWPFLVCLTLLTRRTARDSEPAKPVIGVLMRFSRWGHPAVLLVLVSGLVSTLLLLPDWPSWSGTEYQSLLWLKILLVLTMLTLALINRYVIVPRISLAGRFRQLMINTWIEIIAGTLAILMVAMFATYPPA